MSKKPATGPAVHYLIIAYGSREGEPVSDARYGNDQRRLELDLRLKLPRAGMRVDDIQLFVKTWLQENYRSIKHSQSWHCEFCDKPAKESHQSFMSWAHLTPPRINNYMQFVCDPEKGPCAQRIKELSADINNVTGQTPTTTPAHLLSSSDRWPLMKMCASCEKAKGIKMCAGCGVTRYCRECQKQAWNEHKGFCRMEKTVKYVGDWD